MTTLDILRRMRTIMEEAIRDIDAGIKREMLFESAKIHPLPEQDEEPLGI